MSDFHIDPSASLGPRVKIEAGVNIGPKCVLDGNTKVGARTTLLGGVIFAHDTEIGSDCYVEANVSTTSITVGAIPLSTTIAVGPRSHIGAGSVLTTGVKIGTGAWVEAGSVVVRDVPAHSIVRGNPGKVVGFRDGSTRNASDMFGTTVDPRAFGIADCAVAGVKIYRFPRITDSRGSLTFGEFGRNIPFIPKRYFMVFNVPPKELRGGHAHATCQELIFCIGGSVAVVVDDGRMREEFILDSPDIGLFLPGRVWGVQYKYSPSAVLAVLASEYYDPKDYIHSYEDFVTRMERQE